MNYAPMHEGEVQAAWLGQNIDEPQSYQFELGIRSAEMFHGKTPMDVSDINALVNSGVWLDGATAVVRAVEAFHGIVSSDNEVQS